MGAPIIFSGNNAKLLKPNLDFFGNNQILTGAVDPTITATNANTGSLYLNDSSGKTYQKQDNGSTTNWVALGQSAAGSLNYAQAYFSSGYVWSTTSTSLAPPTNSGTGTFVVRQSNGITLTAGASNTPAITFTPASNTAVYEITAQVGVYNTTPGAAAILQMDDGITVISGNGGNGENGASISYGTSTLTGIYVPGTTSPVTVRLQLATSVTGTAFIGSVSGVSASIPIEWTVTRIDTLVVPGSGGTGITRFISSISTPTTAAAAANTDYVYLVSGTTTLTLPTAVGNTNQYTIRRTGTGTVTVATTSSQTIDGVTTQPIYSANGALSVISNNSNWVIVSTNGLSTANVGAAVELNL